MTMQNNSMLETKIPRLVARFAIPAILAMVVTSTYNIADRAFIGAIPEIGSLAIGALGVTMPLFTLIVGVAVWIGVGGATKLALSLGAQDQQRAKRVLTHMFGMALVAGLCLTIICSLWLEPILLFSGATSATLPYAMQYMQIIVMGSMFNVTAFVMNSALRASGKPKEASKWMVIGCVINLILDPIFIFVLGMGISGAALATVLTQIIVCICIVKEFGFERGDLLSIERVMFDLKLAKEIIVLGLAPFALELAAVFVSITLNTALLRMGTLYSLSTLTIVVSIQQLFTMPIIGIAQGIGPIISFHHGAKSNQRNQKILLFAIAVSLLFLIVGTIAVLFVPSWFIAIFTNDSTLLAESIPVVQMVVMTLPLYAISTLGYVYVQSIGNSKTALVLSLLRQCIAYVPMLVILSKFFGLMGVWMAQPAADVIAAIIVAFILFLLFQRQGKRRVDYPIS
ncbi:MAG: MATE family efflux transporter [Erysipelotrichaceae bacterium]